MHTQAIGHLERAAKHLRLEQSLDALDQIRQAVIAIGNDECVSSEEKLCSEIPEGRR